jgi:hypothetical protein
MHDLTAICEPDYHVAISSRFLCSAVHDIAETGNNGYYAVNLNIPMAYYASGASMIMLWILPASGALVSLGLSHSGHIIAGCPH